MLLAGVVRSVNQDISLIIRDRICRSYGQNLMKFDVMELSESSSAADRNKQKCDVPWLQIGLASL